MTEQMCSNIIPISDPRWMAFIESCADANIFHHPAWMDVLSACYGYTSAALVVTDESGEVYAGLPFMKVSSPFTGRRWVSLPFSDYCNPLSRNGTALCELTSGLLNLREDHQTPKWEVRWSLPNRAGIQTNSDFVLHTIRLNPDPIQVSKQFKRTHLQNIHTAEERGVRVHFGDELKDLRVFYELQLETRKRHGVPSQPWKYFELLWEKIVKSGLGFVLLASHNEEYIAGMVYLAWGKTLIAKYAASREDHFNLRPNNLLFWEGIRWGCEHGFEIFDMGRTEAQNAGLRNFKSRWGAVEEPLYYSILPPQSRHATEGRLANIMHSVIQKSPLWVCRLSGELLYRHVG